MSWNIAKEFPRSNLLYPDKIEVTLYEKWKVFRLLNWMNISFIYGNGTEGKIFVVCFLRSKTMEEFAQVLKDNLRTKDGKYCKPKDDKNIECVCGKTVRICNSFYWQYMVQKPKVVSGKLISRGHWYNCTYVKKKGSLFEMNPDAKSELKEDLVRQRNPGQKREEAEDRQDSKPKRIKSERVRERKEAEASSDPPSDEEEDMFTRVELPLPQLFVDDA